MGNFGDEVVQCVVVDGGFSIEGEGNFDLGRKMFKLREETETRLE